MLVSKDRGSEDLGMGSVVNADPSLVHLGDASVHPAAITEVRIERFCEKYQVTTYDLRTLVSAGWCTSIGTRWGVFPSVCMKCGQPPRQDVHEILRPKTPHGEKDLRGWTHLHCAIHWSEKAKRLHDQVERLIADD